MIEEKHGYRHVWARIPTQPLGGPGMAVNYFDHAPPHSVLQWKTIMSRRHVTELWAILGEGGLLQEWKSRPVPPTPSLMGQSPGVFLKNGSPLCPHSSSWDLPLSTWRAQRLGSRLPNSEIYGLVASAQPLLMHP